VTHRGPYKNGPGEINVPVALEGMVVHPGDIIVGDADGVVAVPLAHAEEILALAKVQLAKETATLKAIAGGKADRRWVDQLLRQQGCDF
jgi:regulator of RNase E activity RraA